jgi:carbon-monoxide dehydrogenase small subunit
MIVAFVLNGERTTARVMTPISLLEVLRDDLSMGGSKNACEQGECGSCSVMLDGELVCSCLVMAVDAEGSDIRTVEGVSPGGFLHPVQEAMHRAGAVQCGFCTPGFVMAAIDLFEHNPSPSKDDIREALAGNICRCTGYGAIIRAFEDLAGETR